MKTALLAFAFSALALASFATAQTASFTLHGSSCPTPEGTPTMLATGVPSLGGSFQVHYQGPNFNGGSVAYFRPHLVIGFDPSLLPGVTIPQSLFLSQPANCNLYVPHDIVIPMPETLTQGYGDNFTFSIPNDATLLGGTFYTQWLTVYYQCGIIAPCFFGWMATSEAGIASIGL